MDTVNPERHEDAREAEVAAAEREEMRVARANAARRREEMTLDRETEETW